MGRRTLWIAAALLVALSSACGGGGRAGARQVSRTESRIYTIAQVKAEDALFIDDRERNLVPAGAIGMRVHLFDGNADALAAALSAAGAL